jgi:predicted transcriptional regulator
MAKHLDEWTKERILQLKQQGLTNVIIARRLNISAATVSGYAPSKKPNKTYVLKSPTGEIYSTSHLNTFCAEYGLNHGAIHRVIRKEYHHHKGWKVLSVTEG